MRPAWRLKLLPPVMDYRAELARLRVAHRTSLVTVPDLSRPQPDARAGHMPRERRFDSGRVVGGGDLRAA